MNGRSLSKRWIGLRKSSVRSSVLFAFFVVVALTSPLIDSGSATSPLNSPLPPEYGGSSSDWPTYLHDAARSSYNGVTTSVNPNNVHNLPNGTKMNGSFWVTILPNATDGSPIVVNGTVYVATEGGVGKMPGGADLGGGYLYALNATTGLNVTGWTAPWLNNTNYSACINSNTHQRESIQNGVTSTATDWHKSIWDNGGNPRLYQINQSTGKIVSTVDVGNDSNAHGHSPWNYTYLWSSPLLHDGHAFVGTADLCEFQSSTNSTNFRYIEGQLLKIDLTNYSVVDNFNVTTGAGIHNNDTGGGIWASPTYDQSTGTVWVATGNANLSSQTPYHICCGATYGEYPQSIVALYSSNLTLRAGCQVQNASHNITTSADYDFGATPTLFYDSSRATYVGAVNKDGVFYAVNATIFNARGPNLACAGGHLDLAWSRTLKGYPGDGTVSPAAFDGTRLYVASGGKPFSGPPEAGFVQALYPNNGSIEWKYKMNSPFDCFADGAVTVADNVVYVTAVGEGSGAGKGVLFALNATNGNSLMTPIQFPEPIAGQAVVAEGKVFVEIGSISFPPSGGGRGYVYAFEP
jgi:hypothetical protein